MNWAKRIKSKHFWKKLLLRLVSAPAYVLVFFAWGGVLGFAGTLVYRFIFEPVDNQPMAHNSPGLPVNNTEVLMIFILAVIAWVGMAFLAGKLMRLALKKLSSPKQYLPAIKLSILVLGWLTLVITHAFLLPEIDYLLLIGGGLMIAIGSLSFALEAAALKFLHLEEADTW